MDVENTYCTVQVYIQNDLSKRHINNTDDSESIGRPRAILLKTFGLKKEY